MQFFDEECFRIIKALEVYRDKEVSHDSIAEAYTRLIDKVKAYQENYSTTSDGFTPTYFRFTERG